VFQALCVFLENNKTASRIGLRTKFFIQDLGKNTSSLHNSVIDNKGFMSDQDVLFKPPSNL